jgi:heptosyltransferase-2
MQKIVVFLPNWVGDVVMATPTVRALKRLYPQAFLSCLIKPSLADVIEGNPHVDEVILCHHRTSHPAHRTWAVIKHLRQIRYDLGVLLTNSIRSAILSWAGGVRRRVGYARDGRGLLLTDRLKPLKENGYWKPMPVIDYYLDVARYLGAQDISHQMELVTSEANEHAADAVWKKLGFSPQDTVVALNPGAAYGPAKRWPSDYFAKLAQRLADRQMKVVVMCGPGETGFAKYIADAALRPRFVKSLADEQLSLGLSKAVVRRSALLVTTDSGPRHFAAAFGRPVVSLFGPTHQEWTITHHPLETRLQKKLPCGPCQQRTCPLKHHQCMTELNVDEVFATAMRLLGQDRIRTNVVA